MVPGRLPVETSSDHGRSATGPCLVRGNGDRWVVDKFDTPGSMSEGDERPGRPWAALTADAIDPRDRDLLASFAGRDTAAWPLVSKHQCGSRAREDAIPTTRRRARAPMCELIVPVQDGQSQRLGGFPLARAEKHVRWQRNGSVGPTTPPPLPFRADEALHQVPGGEASATSGATGLGRTAAIRNARRASGAGGRRTRNTWPTITGGGRRPMWRESARRIAGIGSASAKTPTTGSEGEPGIASTARGSEPGYPIRRPRQTTAEPGPSPRRNGARKARLLSSDPRTDPLLEQELEAVACSRALPRRTRRTSPDAECSSSTDAGAAQAPIACSRTPRTVRSESAHETGEYSCFACRGTSATRVSRGCSAHSERHLRGGDGDVGRLLQIRRERHASDAPGGTSGSPPKQRCPRRWYVLRGQEQQRRRLLGNDVRLCRK